MNTKNQISPVTGLLEVPLIHEFKDSPLINIYYERYCAKNSKRVPLIFLHGGPGNAIDLKPILFNTPLGKVLLEYCDILYFHQRGAGKSQTSHDSEKGIIKAYRVEQFVADVESLRILHFGPSSQPIVFGSSWGGFLGLVYGCCHPSKVRAMVLGSFDISQTAINLFPKQFDDALVQAMIDFPGIKLPLISIIKKVRDGEIKWRPSTSSEKKVGINDLFEMIFPFAAKAKYGELTTLLQAVLNGDDIGQEFINQHDLENPSVYDLGASPGGEATFCANLIDYNEMEAVSNLKFNTFLVDSDAVYNAILNRCRVIGTSSHRTEWQVKLHNISVPLLTFAGKWDPIVPWQLTARISMTYPYGKFLLIDGGHSPIREEGTVLAEEMKILLKSN